MEHFPLTETATFGGTVCGNRFDQWRTMIRFGPGRTVQREHVPDFVEIERATLTIAGQPGRYDVRFPRRGWAVDVRDSPTMLEVAEGLAVGRHSYAVIGESGGEFSAELEVAVRRPTVTTRDGGYVVTGRTMKYSHRHWLEDDRAAQRVGRFRLYLKTIPQSYDGTKINDSLSLNGTWKYKPVEPTSIEDCSVADLGDDGWESIGVPHTWQGRLAEHQGPVWFRRWIDVPATWKGRKVALRFSGIDDDALVFLNAQQVGYNCGWHRPFQLDVSEHVNFGGRNLVAILVRSRRQPGPGAGVTYADMRDRSIVTYPDRQEPVGGIYGDRSELACVGHFGPVVFEPRVYPKFEGLLRVSFHSQAGDAIAPVVMDAESEMIYRPPVLEYRNLTAGAWSDWCLRAAAAYDRDVICFDGRAAGDGATAAARIEVHPFKFGEPVTIRHKGNAVEIAGAETGFSILVPTGEDAAAIAIDIDDRRSGYQQCHVVTIALRGDAEGRFRLDLCFGPNARRDAVWLEGRPDAVDVLAREWEENVYSFSVPAKMSANMAASLRTCRQVLTLCSQVVDDRPSGLLTDLVKYPVFWLRDAAFSIPGAIYAGKIAHQASLATAGGIFDIASQHISITIVQPDGTVRAAKKWVGSQVSSDSSQVAVHAIYKAWCQAGDDWLRAHYDSVKAYLAYSNGIQRAFDNEADGIIRASDGDWYDFAYKGKYEREGASLFLNVYYLKALKYGARMAGALGDTEHAEMWQGLFERGRARLTKPVADGGLLLTDRGHLADTIQTISDTHPNGWNYPRDLDKVTVFGGFRSMPHFVAIHEGLISDPGLVRTIVDNVDRFNMLRPFPGLVQFPWTDFMAAEGLSGPYEATPFGVRVGGWKSLPGCHAAGGRWAFVGGLIQLGLWSADAVELAKEARENQAGYLTLARQPARVFEDAHYSGLFRNEAGDPKDTEGFYYNWGAATPLEALVEGQYGVEPTPDGVRINPRHCEVGDGISKVSVRGGTVSYVRTAAKTYSIDLDTTCPGRLAFVAPAGLRPDRLSVKLSRGDGLRETSDCAVEGGTIHIPYGKGATEVLVGS